MEFAELKQQLDSGVRSKFYIFSGEERQVMQLYIERIVGNGKLLRVSTIERALQHLNTKSLFSSRIVIQVDNDTNIDAAQVLNSISVGNTLIVVCDKPPKLAKDLQKYHVDFKKFTEEQLVWHVTKKLEISDGLAMIIARYCNNDVARIDNEINKIQHWMQARKITEITLDNVNELVTPSIDDRIFEMVDAVAENHVAKVFALYDDLVQLNESPTKMLSLLYAKFRELFLVQTYSTLKGKEIADKTGIPFFRVMNTLNVVGRYSTQSLLDAVRDIQQLEIDIKSGAVDMKLGFENLLIKILGDA